MPINNEHVPTHTLRQRVSDLVMAGAPVHIIADIIDINDDTLRKYYSKELKTSKTVAIERIAKTVYQQALNGDNKSQALYLKTQGNDHGWVEKQVIEQTNADDTQAIKDKLLELESQFKRDY